MKTERTNKEHLEHCLKRIQRGSFKWMPEYNARACREEARYGCLVNLVCTDRGTPPELRKAVALAQKGKNVLEMTAWNDRQKSVKPIIAVLKKAIKLCGKDSDRP